ncbi:hypothetical protein H113_02046 [Trichophyton rubrum MR1459]|uniref:Uncharacterized protein n=1 Tax=Trichophyton rubrum (strain ATCC MYA-4607 / CBS 118892) TaxID=559305 RepID=F2SW83_TRIRC|nr:uncharacterized protein TERG_06802 [Trichophyton rubrum CBS 118892]EGD90577.2 hypothetical protein TERG_06802 [Trichophyton rubrum CBS 118892]EZF98057.1 hypothetical protein H113_02046 [Trichophyton rubrum MR1459]EZG08993.1 hypothetical protein H106_01903 [Trichophyton rubrum CBS 735.88]
MKCDSNSTGCANCVAGNLPCTQTDPITRVSYTRGELERLRAENGRLATENEVLRTENANLRDYISNVVSHLGSGGTQALGMSMVSDYISVVLLITTFFAILLILIFRKHHIHILRMTLYKVRLKLKPFTRRPNSRQGRAFRYYTHRAGVCKCPKCPLTRGKERRLTRSNQVQQQCYLQCKIPHNSG